MNLRVFILHYASAGDNAVHFGALKILVFFFSYTKGQSEISLIASLDRNKVVFVWHISCK